MTAWFASVSATAKALAALAAAVAVGLAFGGWLGLPAQVAVNASDIATNSVEIHEIRETGAAIGAKVDRVICLQLLPAGENPLECP